MKKIIMLLAVVLVICALGIAAADTLNVPALPGGEVDVDVEVSSADAVYSLLTYTYDKSVLEYKGYTSQNNVTNGGSDGKLASLRLTPTLSGVVATLTFKVKANAADGVVPIKFTAAETVNHDEKNTTLTAKAAGVDVTSDQVQAYVKRCYYLLMDRNADSDGLTFWSDGLKAKDRNASQIVQQFLTSEEYRQAGHDDNYTVTCLYKAMLNRKPEADGFNYWVDRLQKNGLEDVLNAYSGTEEFKAICDTYGIDPGDGSGSSGGGGGSTGTGIEGFVKRCYKQALSRDADQDGVNFWVGKMQGGMDPRDVANEFVFSRELELRGLSNDDFIKTLYRLYMGREAEAEGLAYWNQQMAGGKTREEVNNGFAGSEEFAAIVSGFGIR